MRQNGRLAYTHVRVDRLERRNRPIRCIEHRWEGDGMRLHPASYAFASAVGIASGYYIFKPALEVRDCLASRLSDGGAVD